jgi:solute carrier family 34 (sodium-dependent phosphate cotransporter)
MVLNDSSQNKIDTQRTWSLVLLIVGSILLFLFSLDLMVSSLRHLGSDTARSVIEATVNPFAGLFVGLLVTALIQSSSTTTALTVAIVASGALSFQSAVPVIMGANIGTTITSTIISLGFINKKKEFKRAVTAGTYHCFFNLLTVLILFPLELNYGFLSSMSAWLGHNLFSITEAASTGTPAVTWTPFSFVTDFVVAKISNGIVLAILSFVLLVISILIFRKLISNLLKAQSPETFSRFFFAGELKSFFWGLITTAAIRSSTITTSLVVPIVAKKVVKMRMVAPFIMGANIGTTITAFIAAMLNSNNSAINIAIAHFLFNFIGVLLFFPIPAMKEIPIRLSVALGKLTLRYRIAGFLFILLTFFIIPFSLIYLHQE